jgi:hypothetical protein
MLAIGRDPRKTRGGMTDGPEPELHAIELKFDGVGA